MAQKKPLVCGLCLKSEYGISPLVRVKVPVQDRRELPLCSIWGSDNSAVVHEKDCKEKLERRIQKRAEKLRSKRDKAITCAYCKGKVEGAGVLIQVGLVTSSPVGKLGVRKKKERLLHYHCAGHWVSTLTGEMPWIK